MYKNILEVDKLETALRAVIPSLNYLCVDFKNKLRKIENRFEVTGSSVTEEDFETLFKDTNIELAGYINADYVFYDYDIV